MPWSILEIPMALPAYVLVLFRLSGLILTAPVFASPLVPARVRAALVFVIAAMIFPMVRSQAPADLSLMAAVVGGAGELMIGMTIGLSAALMVMGAELGGHMISQQAGIALGQVFNPTSEGQSTVIAQIYSLTLVIIFLLAGGHRAMMAALLDTFNVVPLFSASFDESLVLSLVELMTAAFIFGIRLAGPVLIALFLTGTALGFLSRTMPQLNILTIGFTVRVMLALAVAGFTFMGTEDMFLHYAWEALAKTRVVLGLGADQTGFSY